MDEIYEELLSKADEGTIKYTALARKLNIPLSTVHHRMRKLEKEGIVKYYKAEIDWKKAGLPLTAFVLINIDVNMLKDMHKTQDKLLKELLNLAYIKEGYIITGEADILVKVIAKDTSHFKEILLNHIDALEGVIKTKTVVVLD
jgi:DNA-binding Lrp family transcriptional regulator